MESEDDFLSDEGFGRIETQCRSDTRDALSVVFNRDIRPLIDLIDKLRRFGIQKDVALPNVVVVGDQSSGKSSIIEALSGVQLPRGKGIVTRCPLELQLKRVTGKKWKAKLSYKNKNGKHEDIEILNHEEVEFYVREAQEAICGPGKGVSSELITLRIESPEIHAPDLTLIDLPGIARIAVHDQPENICETIRSMIMKHVSSDRTVILCVLSTNLDVAVNESIRIARTVDPQGERTIDALKTKFSASNLQDIIARNRGRELNGFLDFGVFKDLIPAHIKTYEVIAIDLCKNMRKNVEDCLSRVVTQKCGHLPEIEKDLKEIVNQQCKEYQDDSVDRIKFLFKQESIIFTMDVVFNREMEAHKQKKMNAINEANRQNKNRQFGSLQVEEEEDTNPQEMHDMLGVYLQIVNHRLADNIPLTIMQCLLMELSRSIEDKFIDLCSSKSALEKVRENTVLLEKRQMTKDKISRLQKANAELSRF